MIQFLADQLDQLDLALGQLALKDRNFDRFALMLIDNVVEVTLHQHALDICFDAELHRPWVGPRYDPKLVAGALGSYFGAEIPRKIEIRVPRHTPATSAAQRFVSLS